MSVPVADVALAARHRTIGGAFDQRRNSLNFLRLTLALCVVLYHATPGGWDTALFSHMGIGPLAVFGFFAISGFLIAASAERNNVGRYLWQRFLRIFPAFWVCLLVIAFVFAALVPLRKFGIMTNWVSSRQTPIDYVRGNWWLRITQTDIDGRRWDGPLWTLSYEFVCYLLLAGLALIRVLQRKLVVVAIAAVLWSTQIILTLSPTLSQNFNVYENYWLMNFIKFATVFLTGTLIYLYRDWVPDSGLLVLGCAVVLLASLWLPTPGVSDDFNFADSSLLVLLIAYPMIWLGIHLPFQAIGARNDYSYGIYIYAYPVQVLLAIWGVKNWGTWPYLILVVFCTIPLAVASWWLVEKRALKLKKLDVVRAKTIWVRLVGGQRLGESRETA